jgi:general secretion pathway protein G
MNKKKKRSRGMTLIEVLIVLAIVALISGVVAIAALGHLAGARIQTTRESARILRQAVATYQMNHPSADGCPTVDALVATNEIDQASKTLDAWDKPFKIDCDEHGGIAVVSGGPDKRMGSEDDIRVPDPPKTVAAGSN